MSRAQQLEKRFHDILRGTTKIEPRLGNHFLEGLCAQADPVACVSKIVESANGPSAVQQAMRFELSPKFMNGLACDVIEYLLRAQDVGGGVLDCVILSIIEPPLFWNAFSSEFEKGALMDRAQSAFARLLLYLLKMSDKVSTPYHELAKKSSVLDKLVSSPLPDVKAAGTHIKEIITSTSVPVALRRLRDGPGGRHDNDFINFREIAIIPTADEIQDTKRPFLRPAALLDDPEAKNTRTADYLDNTFRMLREDMLHELKEELQIALGKKKGRKRGATIDGLRMMDVYTGPDDRKSRWGLMLQCGKDLPIFKGVNEKDRRKFLSDDHRGSKFLRHQSLACLVADDVVVSFGVIQRVEELLAKKLPVIVIQIEGEASITKTLLTLGSAQRIQVIQIDTAIFAFEPVLKVLQKMQVLPLADEILFWEQGAPIGSPPSTTTTITVPLARNPSMDLQPLLQTPTTIKLDTFQAQSLLAGLNQRVSLIQGPPGTGKSFIGALLAKALHDFSEQKILVVCYTNHALDQFLEDLLKIGIPDSNIVRLGGRPNAAISHLGIQQQVKAKYNRTKVEWMLVDQLKSRSEFLHGRLKESFKKIVSSQISLDDILTHIEFEDADYFEAFQVPVSSDGMSYVDRNGRPLPATYLIHQWSNGWNAGIFKDDANVLAASKIWSMDKAQRQKKFEEWRLAICKELVEDVWKIGRDYNDCQDELSRKFGEATVALLKQKRIIGCTTTGAAKYTDDLRAVCPDVLLVEEAGEILESHVITALGEGTTQMILIGDHKQLRPKVNKYELTVEKNEGYDLNRSLFERLVLKGFPHVTLSAQHRMRPEISAFIRELTYPGLTDASKTMNRDNIRGLQNNIIFMNHTQPEDDEARISDRGDAGSPSSKRNTFEANMVLKIVRYLAQQGYGGDNMVILTPYLGQLSLLRDTLRNENDPILNDLDSNDLSRAGLLLPAASKAKRRIRLATIDNYQGEESDIVVTSLTRSNSDNSIGFMNSAERLNVLISRARNGLILIGNSNTFQSSKSGGKLWGDFLGLLRKGNYIYDGFPIKCERHPTRTTLIQQPNGFDDQSPDGGCTEPCGTMLSCGLHTCSRKCHPSRLTPRDPDVHLTMLCQHQFNEQCPAGTHRLLWKCHQGRPAKCSACEKEAKRLAKQAQRDLEAQDKRDAEKREHDLRMLELEADLQFQKEAMADVQAAKDRHDEILQKKKEIEDAKKRVKNVTAAAKKSQSSTTPTAQANSPNQSRPPSPSQSANVNANANANNNAGSQAPTAPRSTVKSAAKDKWEQQKRSDGVQNDAIDKIMDMTGLEEVKEQILRIKAKIDTMKRQGVPLNKERMNLCLLGNPGTGKTTVARLYAQFLESIQVLPGDAFLETTGSKLSYEGVKGATALIDDALKVGGGAIFIDEAYQLVSEHDQSGRQVLDFLLAEMENRVGTLVFILAGYNKQMEKFFEHNPGLPSRVPYQLQFADYTDAELLTMLEDLIVKRYNGQMKVEDGVRGLYVRIVVKRLGRGRGTPGFGNARALQNTFSKVCERQAERVEKARRGGLFSDDFLLTKEDLIGPDPSQVIPNSAAWAKLQGMTGLGAVKESIRNLFALIETNYQRELEEKEPMQMSLNRVFLGSPGTGKTTVAKLYGQVLAELGLLSNGEVVVKNPSDFVGAYLGHSEKNTKAILDSTRGKVLVIDEAYMLYSKSSGGQDSFKSTVIDTIVAEIQSVPREDRCVLLLGYKEQMEEMFQNVNPGLARRFAIENAFNFEDFTEPQLMEILEYKLKNQDLAATDDAKRVAADLLSRMKDRPNFGNAGEVENMLGLAKARYQKRMASVPASERSDVIFEPQDFDPDYDRNKNASANLAKLFEDVVGCDDVIQKLDRYQKIARTMKGQGLDMRTQIPSNFIFKGPPGTGKTTTARKLGQVYYDMGFLASKDVIECSASDLVGQYVGHTGPKTKALFEKALGKVLFVDEAYRLSQGHFAKEAMDEIVGLMTNERFMNKIVIILAGYNDEMNSLLAVNPGLSSRFSEEINFINMTPDQCLTLLSKDLQKNNITVAELSDTSSARYHEMQVIIQKMSALSSWGNARDVKTIGKRMVQQAFANAANGQPASLTVDEAVNIMKSMLDDQRGRLNVPRINTSHMSSSPPPPMASSSSSAPPPPPSASASSSQSSRPPPPPPPPPSSKKGSKPPARPPQPGPTKPGPNSKNQKSKGNTPTTGTNTPVERDPGVSDAIWNELQASKAAEEEAKRQALEEQRRLQQEHAKAMEKQKQAEAQAKARAEALERAKREAEELARQIEMQRRDAERSAEVKAARERAVAALKKKQQEEAKRARELAEARRREEEVRAARERAAAALRKKQQEEAERQRKEQEIQRKIRSMGVCVQGFQWIPIGHGYRCAGGMHYLSNAQLGI